MRAYFPIQTISLAVVLLVVTSLPLGAEQGRTPGYDLEFSQFLQSQGARNQASVVVIETRFTRMLHEDGRTREIVLEGDFASGFIFNREGIVVAPYSVVVHAPSTYFARTSGRAEHEADYILVRLADGRTYNAEIVGSDGPSSLAVIRMLQVEPEDSVPIGIGNARDVIVGEPIMFLGYNWLSRSRISYDFGVISALRPKFPSIEESTNQYFQVNVPQNEGNRGGVVIDSSGDVIAIMTDIAPYADATEIHFALPIDAAVEVVDAILNVGEMRRPWFGFRLLEMNPQIERAYSILSDLNGDGLKTDADRDLFEAETGIDLRKCLFVIYVDPDSPTGDIGMREVDILMEFNGVPVGTMDELSNQIERYRIGDRVTLEWMRREYAVWDPYIAEVVIEYSGQREEAEGVQE